MPERPIIGVVPLIDYERESLWMLPGYFDGIAEAGGIPVMLPLTADQTAIEQLLRVVDGLLLTGGQDVEPTRYYHGFDEVDDLIEETSRERDAMEAVLIPCAITLNIPILGICRGIQSINAILGGTLWQDLATQCPSDVTHHGDKPYDQPDHTVEVLEGTPLAEVLGAGELAVTSYHHQAVRDLAPGLVRMAVAPDGIIEALWRPASAFLWAVQWHPEFSHAVDEASRKLFQAFVFAAQTLR